MNLFTQTARFAPAVCCFAALVVLPGAPVAMAAAAPGNLTAGLPPIVTAPPSLDATARLANGLTLVTRIDRTSPRVAFSMLVRAGAADETPLTDGWRRVLANSMLRATYYSLPSDNKASHPAQKGSGPQGAMPQGSAPTVTALTGTEMQRLAESIGGQFGATVGDDTIEFWATGESNHADLLLSLLLNVVEHPRLSQADIAAGKRRVAEETDYEASDIAVAATSTLRGEIYRDASGKPIAYGLPRSTADSLRGLTDDKIRSFYHAYVKPSQLFVGAAGDIDVAGLAVRLAAVAPDVSFLAASQATPVQAPGTIPVFHPAARTDPPLVVKQLPTQDAWVFISFLAPKSNGSDAAALNVISAALAETQLARLPKRLLARVPTLGGAPHGETALQTSATLSMRRYGSEFVVYAQTGASNVDEVKNALLDEMRKLRETSLSEDELNRAKHYVRGSHAVENEALRDRAFSAALAPATNAPPDDRWPAEVGAVTAADVRRVANLFTQNYAVGLIMPQEPANSP